MEGVCMSHNRQTVPKLNFHGMLSKVIVLQIIFDNTTTNINNKRLLNGKRFYCCPKDL